MKKVLQGASALAAIIVAAPVAAHATDGWYGRADVGYSFDGNVKYGAAATGPTRLNGDSDHKYDWTEHLGLGYAFQDGLRLEAEAGYRFNHGRNFANSDGSMIDGDSRAWSAMANAFWDFNKGGTIQPYVGAGIGGAEVHTKASSLGMADNTDDAQWKVAYQGMFGLAFVLSPQLMADFGYRYFAVPNGEHDGTHLGVATRFDVDYDQHAVTAGLRYQFAPPAPPPAPPPPPVVAAPAPQVCPAQDFKVYFEWDRSNLNASAVDTINAAAARAKACNVSTVRVVGFTDTSGSAKYNLGLSNRRASVVRDALVGAGIPAALVSTEGQGETNLDKPTKDGVREPLNRRTAVTISFQ